MSNPQDSPKTERELAEKIVGIFQQRSLARVGSILTSEIYNEIQSYIDAQKAEVTKSATGFAKKLYEWSKWDEEVFESRVHDWAEAIAARDQKLVQEAVKPWRKAVERLIMAIDLAEAESGEGILAEDYDTIVEQARALLSQPQEVK